MNEQVRQSQNMKEFASQLPEEMSEENFLSAFLGTEDVSAFLHQGVSRLLNKFMLKERDMHLRHHTGDNGNGFCPERTIHMGTLPMQIEIPRTRDDFYPSCLPKYARNIPTDYQKLLYAVLLHAKSFTSVRRTLNSMGLTYSPEELDELLNELYNEAKEYNSRPLAADYMFLFIDAKVLYLRDAKGVLSKGVNYIVVGVGMNARKEILLNKVFWQREAADTWRTVLLDLKNRGLTRVLSIITDDFSGLTKLIAGLFPQSDHQLCTVHLLRNAYRHLTKDDYQVFQQTMREICSCSSYQVALDKFMELCEQLKKKYPSFIKHIEERAEHYLAFTRYPHAIWGHIRTTNAAEGINNQIETIKRNAGGHFHTEREITIKTWIMSAHLQQTKWKHPCVKFKADLPDLMTLFTKKFEQELTNDYFLTQNF